MVKSLEVHVLCLGRPSQISSYETRGNEVIKKKTDALTGIAKVAREKGAASKNK